MVGEPTSVAHAGDTLKIGRRGSINFKVTVTGVQGHVGYPQKANNPIPVLAELVTQLAAHKLDKGNAHFDPSTLAFTTMDVGNDATNVIPARGAGRLQHPLQRQAHAGKPDQLGDGPRPPHRQGNRLPRSISAHRSAAPSFLTAPGKFTQLVSDTVASVTGQAPFFSTSGGTSDARFIKDHLPGGGIGPGGRHHAQDR